MFRNWTADLLKVKKKARQIKIYTRFNIVILCGITDQQPNR